MHCQVITDPFLVLPSFTLIFDRVVVEQSVLQMICLDTSRRKIQWRLKNIGISIERTDEF